MSKYLEPTPWDRRNFPIDTYQLTEYSEAALKETDQVEGHFTMKVDPLVNKALLHQYGFYYTDTLTDLVVTHDRFFAEKATDAVTFSKDYPAGEVLAIAEEAFQGGRYHRDFQVPDHLADLRYRNWVKDLIEQERILVYKQAGQVDGFFAYKDDDVLLMAMHQRVRGKGFAIPFAAACIKEQFARTEAERLTAPISPRNMASMNVFIGLGFNIGGCVDIYHKVNGSFGGDVQKV